MEISEEAISTDYFDLVGNTQERLIDAYIAAQRAELAAICGDYVAWMMYPPTLRDDPKEYEPYWTRLKDIEYENSENE